MNVYCNCNLKNQLHGIINDLVITDYHRKILEERFLKEVMVYETKSKVTEFFYLFFSIFVTIATIILPALLSIQEVNYSDDAETDREFKKRIYWCTWVISLLVTISNGLVQFLNLHTQFITFSQTREKLLAVGWSYFELSGTFRKGTHESNFIKFCEMVDLIKKTHMSQEFRFITPQEDESDKRRKSSIRSDDLDNLELGMSDSQAKQKYDINQSEENQSEENQNNINPSKINQSQKNPNKNKLKSNIKLEVVDLNKREKNVVSKV